MWMKMKGALFPSEHVVRWCGEKAEEEQILEQVGVGATLVAFRWSLQRALNTAIGTFVTYVAHKLQKKDWDYDINMITWSAGLFYGYATFVPLCLYVILKYFSAPSGLVQLVYLYGYSLFVFIPPSCVSVVPVEEFRWVIAGVAGFMSATSVALNLQAHIMSAGERWFLIVLGIFLLQLALAVVLKFYLFTVTV
ncbi:hypothetical protein IFM89_009649 [Coptis chinensis]|uniref:Protein YIP n=1 Tax=Coptis chinensis TaxID=261450 RepID=A0A835M832_9MAGN|nr:hypothetical protein IFM89_009649 [Coptis chinensis]